MPMSPGISGISGGFSGFDRAETVWKCSGCQRELGRGTFAPHVKNCPYCNVELTRITDEHGMNRPNPSNFSGYVREQFPNSPAAAPNYNPVTTPTMPMMPPVVNFAPPADDAATEGTTRKVTIIVGSLLGLAMIAGLVVALVGDMKKPAARKKRRPRKKSDDLDW